MARVVFLFVGLLFTVAAFAQRTPPRQQQQGQRVELLQADSLEGGVYKGENIMKLLGNVVFRQDSTYMYADSAYQYRNRNSVEAFGNVRINQADTVTITGNHATYNGDTKIATMRGNVVMQDSRMTLTTPFLDYNLNTKKATYKQGGTIVDSDNQLQSQTGTYDTQTKLFTFRGNVLVFTRDYEITTDNLKYNTVSKIAYFQGPTNIRSQRGNLYAESGEYNTLQKVSRFGRNAWIESENYRILGDNLYYDEGSQYGQATGNVRLISKKDSVVITGQVAKYWEGRGRSVVYGSPVMRALMENDTLFMSADTLVSVEAKADTLPSYIYAYHDVRIFKSDLQGRCDSLIYNSLDSMIYLRHAPVLWSNNSQLVAEEIDIQLRNQTIHKMFMNTNAFMVQEDTLRNYNQVKGRDMVAHFPEGKLSRVDVNGNSESIYFALEGDTALTGMNKAICSDMVLQFGENKLKTISFLVSPDASFIPPHELTEAAQKLEGFGWFIEDKPDREDVLEKRSGRRTRIYNRKPSETTSAGQTENETNSGKTDQKPAAKAQPEAGKPRTDTTATPDAARQKNRLKRK